MYCLGEQSSIISETNLNTEEDVYIDHFSKCQRERDRTVSIIDWDDTICPSSWLKSHNLLPKPNENVKLTPKIKRKLEKVARRVKGLLKKALSCGPVFVVTAAEHGWVETSCGIYLSSVKAILSHPDIHVISARSWYESQYGFSGTVHDWKDEVIQIIASECFASDSSSCMDPSGSYFSLISIGDSIVERNACHSAADATPFTFAKTLKFIERPNIREIAQQIELTMTAFDEICLAESSLDFRVSRSELQAYFGK